MANVHELERIQALEAELAKCHEERTAAKRAEALFQLFHDSAKDYAFVTLDLQNRIVDWSSGAERLLGYSKEEIVGRDGHTFFAPEDIASGAVERELLLARTQGRAEDERWHQRKDGTRFWGSGVMVALRDSEGRQQGFGKIFRDLTARKQMEDRLTASLREKDLLLREIHHRVKNNLQVVSSLISLQARATRHPEMQSVFDELQDRVRAIAALHETLYSSPDLQNILFGSYMEQLLRELLAFHSIDPRRISVAIDAADLAVRIEQALPLGLIVNELVTNCLKHAFPNEDKGEIKVCLQYLSIGPEQTVDGAQCELSVTDNGRGLDVGQEIHDGQSMGLRIIELLVSDLRGTFHIDQDRPHGSKFTIRFPLEPDE